MQDRLQRLCSLNIEMLAKVVDNGYRQPITIVLLTGISNSSRSWTINIGFKYFLLLFIIGLTALRLHCKPDFRPYKAHIQWSGQCLNFLKDTFINANFMLQCPLILYAFLLFITCGKSWCVSEDFNIHYFFSSDS
jgi:hypothetical protein